MAEYSFKVIDGIKCYNPEKAFSNDCYPREAYDNLFKVEQNNFWFKARNRLIIYLFRNYISETNKLKTLEIGCGTGFVLQGLKKFPNLILYGAEIFLEGLKYASKRSPDIEFIQVDATNLQFVSEFDIICSFDVLEHIEEDEKAISNIYRALTQNGLFFVSVPQHKFIWGAIDELSNHKRRYSRKELKLKLKKSGFKILYTSSFVFILFPIMIISRLLNKNTLPKKNDGQQNLFHELNTSKVINFIFSVFMFIDELFIKIGIKLPYGGSLIMIAQKGN